MTTPRSLLLDILYGVRFGLLTMVSFWVMTVSSRAQTSFPMVTHAMPLAVQRGKTSEVTVQGVHSFAGAFAAFVSGEGVTATVATPEKKENLNSKTPAGKRVNPRNPAAGAVLQVTVADNAPLGPREIRVATAQGMSTVGQLIITDHPVTVEKGKTATPADARTIAINSMVVGTIAAVEQVDYYKFQAHAGQDITISIESGRLMHKIHDLQEHFDPMVTVFDPQGRELAANDDYFFSDPMLHCKCTKAGDYVLAVRDVRFKGDPRWTYAMLVTDRPFVTALHPLALQRQGNREVRAEGFRLPKETLAVPLKQNVPPGTTLVSLNTSRGLSNPVAVEISDLPLIAEIEPNNKIAQAATLGLGTGITGVIGSTGDTDYFALKLTKGEMIRLEVKARRLGSSLDANLRLLNAKEVELAASDDMLRTKDSLITYTAPETGTYYVEVRDLLYRGGATFPYFLEILRDDPDFELVCDDDKAAMPPGGACAWYIKLNRRGGFTGPVQVRVEGLPAGVQAAPLTIPTSITQGCLILHAKKDAPLGAARVRVLGRAEFTNNNGKKLVLEHLVEPTTEIYFPGGGRGVYPVDTHMVQVCSHYDLTNVTAGVERVTLKPGEKVTIPVEIERDPRYKGRVFLDVRLRHLGAVFGDPLPPGVTMLDSGKTALGPTDTKGSIVLQADAKALPGEAVPIAVLANVSINFVVKRAYASRPIWVQVLGDQKKSPVLAK